MSSRQARFSVENRSGIWYNYSIKEMRTMRDPILTQYTVTTEYPMDAPIRIAHVSDLHERRAFDVLDLLRSVKPDLIVVTGDTLERYDNRPQYQFEHKPIKRAIIVAIHYTNYFLRHFESDAKMAKTENAYAFLSEAARLAPVYVSLGNHSRRYGMRISPFIGRRGSICWITLQPPLI
jgi:predicted MPP superfamily phosphohydrolase